MSKTELPSVTVPAANSLSLSQTTRLVTVELEMKIRVAARLLLPDEMNVRLVAPVAIMSPVA